MLITLFTTLFRPLAERLARRRAENAEVAQILEQLARATDLEQRCQAVRDLAALQYRAATIALIEIGLYEHSFCTARLAIAELAARQQYPTLRLIADRQTNYNSRRLASELLAKANSPTYQQGAVAV